MRKPIYYAIRAVSLSACLSACEAPLVLDGVEHSRQSPVRRTDVFLGAVDDGRRAVVVGAHGVIVSAPSGTDDWSRAAVEGRPVFIDIASCHKSVFAALSMEGQVWTAGREADDWQRHDIGTPEVPQAVTCDNKGVIWVVGSFSTIFSSEDQGASWRDHSLGEDIILSTVQFIDDRRGYITGEFGTVLVSDDGGRSWEFSGPIPKEFFPLAGVFQDRRSGWVVGLNGTVYSTRDGGASWRQERTGVDAPLFGVSALGGRLVAVGDYGTAIQRSIEGDAAWRALEIPFPSRFFFRVNLPLDNDRLIIGGGAGSLQLVDLKNARLSGAGGG